MKKLLFIASLTVAFSFTSCKENTTDANANAAVSDSATSLSSANEATIANSANETGEYPVMTFDKTEHDFGTLAQGTNVEHLFTFTNTGTAPLIISDAKGSCGCTVPQYTNEPVQPGQKGEMLVKFNGSGQNQRTVSVNITTNTEKVTERITIKAFVEAPAQ